eukprot:1304120-Pyramimonas_sp.AAC.1
MASAAHILSNLPAPCFFCLRHARRLGFRCVPRVPRGASPGPLGSSWGRFWARTHAGLQEAPQD